MKKYLLVALFVVTAHADIPQEAQDILNKQPIYDGDCQFTPCVIFKDPDFIYVVEYTADIVHGKTITKITKVDKKGKETVVYFHGVVT